MSTSQIDETCLQCGGEFITEFDTRTGKYTPVTMCKCGVAKFKVGRLIEKYLNQIDDIDALIKKADPDEPSIIEEMVMEKETLERVVIDLKEIEND